MLFSSITFLYYFLPAVFFLSYILPGKFRNVILLAASLIFYGWAEPGYVIYMLVYILAGYLAGIWMQHGYPRIVMTVSLIFCIGGFVFFKYTNFFLENINGIFPTDIPLLKLTLPIGISFYTFQIISYLLDVYYKRIHPQKSFLLLATYISMFPQLIAGPIVRYTDIEPDLEKPSVTLQQLSEGVARFLVGLSKKVLIADQLGELCKIAKESTQMSVVLSWMYGVAVLLHYYFDFSGYSDMAIGLGRIFGFSFSENFRHPYVSRSITEFWRRWHISLGTWFRDYVYIPLGGNRVGKGKHIRNIFLVWMLTGFWHGASWNFILWGVFFAVLLLFEKFQFMKFLEKHRVFSHGYVLFFLIISFVIFDAENLVVLGNTLEQMFFLGEIPLVNEESIYYFRSYFSIFLIAVVGATEWPVICYGKVKKRILENQKPFHSILFSIAEVTGLVCLLLLSTAYIVDGSYQPFLYFRF